MARKPPRPSRAGGFAKPKRRGGKLRTASAAAASLPAAPTRAEHKALNSYRNKKAAHARRKGR